MIVAEGQIELHDTPLTHSHGPYSIAVADLAVGRAGLEPPYRRDFHGAPPTNMRREKKEMMSEMRKKKKQPLLLVIPAFATVHNWILFIK